MSGRPLRPVPRKTPSRDASRRLPSASVSNVSVASSKSSAKLSAPLSKKPERLSNKSAVKREMLPRRKDYARRLKKSKLERRQLKPTVKLMAKTLRTTLLPTMLSRPQPALTRLRMLTATTRLKQIRTPMKALQLTPIMTKMKPQCNPRTRKLLEPLLPPLLAHPW